MNKWWHIKLILQTITSSVVCVYIKNRHMHAHIHTHIVYKTSFLTYLKNKNNMKYVVKNQINWAWFDGMPYSVKNILCPETNKNRQLIKDINLCKIWCDTFINDSYFIMVIRTPELLAWISKISFKSEPTLNGISLLISLN